MKLKVVGSGSTGNAYILENDTEALLVEAGVSFSKVKEALNFNMTKVKGCIISHEHGDHAKYVKDTLKNRINTYMTEGTAEAIKITNKRLITLKKANDNYQILQIGGFKILPFKTIHDAKEPVGFLINHKETGNILFITDSMYLPFKVKNVNNILIECNYSEKIISQKIKNRDLPLKVYRRIMANHMSLETCQDTLAKMDTSQVNNIVLIHLSEHNGNENQFKDEIGRTVHKNIYVASKGLEINFNKTPF